MPRGSERREDLAREAARVTNDLPPDPFGMTLAIFTLKGARDAVARRARKEDPSDGIAVLVRLWPQNARNSHPDIRFRAGQRAFSQRNRNGLVDAAGCLKKVSGNADR